MYSFATIPVHVCDDYSIRFHDMLYTHEMSYSSRIGLTITPTSRPTKFSTPKETQFQLQNMKTRLIQVKNNFMISFSSRLELPMKPSKVTKRMIPKTESHLLTQKNEFQRMMPKIEFQKVTLKTEFQGMMPKIGLHRMTPSNSFRRTYGQPRPMLGSSRSTQSFWTTPNLMP